MTTYRKSSGAVFWSKECEDPIAAINFALDNLDDHYDRAEFLKDWREGDVSQWPDFLDKVLTAGRSILDGGRDG